MKIGVDIDGVLADFNTKFINRVIAVTGKDLFPPRPFDIPTWNYPEHYGYTKEEVSKTWESIKADHLFWYGLPHIDGAIEGMEYLLEQITNGAHDLYFITARLGVDVKWQTERWLIDLAERVPNPPFEFFPTVLISSQKGLCARALDLDVYIDDKWENCMDVKACRPHMRVFLFDQPWNRQTRADRATGGVLVDAAPMFDLLRVSSVVGIADNPGSGIDDFTGGTGGGDDRTVDR